MTDTPEYKPPEVWVWEKDDSPNWRYSNTNRPVAGATHEKELPRGKHPLQLLVQSRRCVLRGGGDRSACSRQVRARIRRCRTRTRAEWWPYRDAGCLPERPSRRGDIARGSLPPPRRLCDRFFTELGGLLSYGNDVTDNFRRAATYADRVLKGAKPSELPVQAPVKFELVINLKTAKTLGLDVPLHRQQRADEVIE